MGKSSASCLKIIACGSDSVDHDDLQTTETKGSSDRRGWSFRKRSARHRVLSNSVVSESPSSVNKSPPSANKEHSDSAAVSFLAQPDVTVPEKNSVIQPDLTIPEKTSVVQPDLTKPEKTSLVQPDLTVPEKISVIQPTEEKTELAVQPDSMLSDAVASREGDTIAYREGECKADAILDEHSIIIIQAAIRSLLAQRLLLKQQNIIKLQAAVRGHIVRNHAVGTLRCVQAIVKMQALVRAHRARLHADGSGEQSESAGKDNDDSTFQSKKRPKSNGTYTYVSIEKLLGNAFARQLMESTPRTKSMNIKCEPLKSDSAWSWLERWVSVSTVTKEEPYESESDEEQHKARLISDGEQHKESLEHSEGKEDIPVPYDCYNESTDIKFGVDASVEASENVGNLMSYEENNLDVHSSKPISSSSSHSELHNIEPSDSRPDTAQSVPIEVKEQNLIEKVEDATYLSEKDDTGNKQDIADVNFRTEEQPETEVKKISRKPSNPAFIAAQSKFEEMSSTTASPKLNTSSSHEAEAASSLDKNSSSADQPLKSTDIGVTNSPMNVESMNHIGISECGTELSIRSTLDSLNTSYPEVNTIEQETKVSDEIEHPRTKEDSEHEAVENPIIQETNPSYNDTNKLERDESDNSATQVSIDSITAADSPQLEKEPEAGTSGASPRSHITVSESQATPSSQVSVKTRKSKAGKTESTRKKKSSSADNKKSPSVQNQDSSLEHKTAKRRNSFGSAKSDPKEHEPRDSSSSNSLPSYMQATQSAKAKAIANGSPRSSPDVHEKEIYLKKRQSLPGVDERQGSPRIQRSLSQAQQSAKGNGMHSPQDRKWRR